MKILLSIKPEFVKEIVEGKKKYEYRKKIFKKPVDGAIIYSTMPEGLIVGMFSIKIIEQGTPEEIWERTSHESGISKDFFDNYFSCCKTGYAIRITDFVKFETPINPQKVSNFNAPQSWRYISEEELDVWKIGNF